MLETPGLAFAPTAEQAHQARPLWPMLLTLAAILFPVDVGVRRLRLTTSDWEHLIAWIRQRMPRRTVETTAAPPLLGGLFEARERARRRGARGTALGHVDNGPVPQRAAAHERPERAETPMPLEKRGPEPAEPSPSASEDTLARLRQARERARRR